MDARKDIHSIVKRFFPNSIKAAIVTYLIIKLIQKHLPEGEEKIKLGESYGHID